MSTFHKELSDREEKTLKLKKRIALITDDYIAYRALGRLTFMVRSLMSRIGVRMFFKEVYNQRAILV